jgi:regulator of protease activity HflC (stomatin/prohibitin superfamily)
VGMVERCGNYHRQASPGINCVCWPVDSIVGVVSMRVQQLEVRVETKTLDNVFVDVVVSIQYSVIQERIWESFYTLQNPRKQITAYVFDVVRSIIPTTSLDEAFSAKEVIAVAIKDALTTTMRDYGYIILNSLVTDMTPDYRVRNAMNEINASKRLKEAAAEKAEGDKVLTVKSAEAEAESKYLSGVGVARQRSAIVGGLQRSIGQISDKIDGAKPRDVVDLLLITQYFDMLRDIGSCPSTNTILIPDTD